MISVPVPSWQTVLAEAYRDPQTLLSALGLPADAAASGPADGFPVLVPKGFVARMKAGDAMDPLLRQVLPGRPEDSRVPGFLTDPVGDLPAMRAPGLIHKYRGRVLLITTGACAMHCRYCFRRHFAYGRPNAARHGWKQAVAYVRGNPSLSEVILSGGDPLALSDDKLALLCAKLSAIPHVKRLRIHTRFPVAVPERVTDALISWLAATRLKTVFVIQANHANEIDASVAAAMKRLTESVSVLLNQSVLLKGVNDDAAALAALSEKLFEAGVMPYYLNMLDRVQGAAHFEVGDERARQIMDHLRARLPGYLVPKLVREEAGLPFKLPIC